MSKSAFLASLDSLSRQGNVFILAEDEPIRENLSEKVRDVLSVRASVAKKIRLLAEETGYDVTEVREGYVFNLQYGITKNVPCVSLEECVAYLQNVVEITRTLTGTTTHLDPSRHLVEWATTLPQPTKKEASEQGVLVADLPAVEQKKMLKILTAVHYGGLQNVSNTALRILEDAQNCVLRLDTSNQIILQPSWLKRPPFISVTSSTLSGLQPTAATEADIVALKSEPMIVEELPSRLFGVPIVISPIISKKPVVAAGITRANSQFVVLGLSKLYDLQSSRRSGGVLLGRKKSFCKSSAGAKQALYDAMPLPLRNSLLRRSQCRIAAQQIMNAFKPDIRKAGIKGLVLSTLPTRMKSTVITCLLENSGNPFLNEMASAIRRTPPFLTEFNSLRMHLKDEDQKPNNLRLERPVGGHWHRTFEVTTFVINR